MNWIKKRHLSTANANYIKSNEEVLKDGEIEVMFKKIDLDNSGIIDIEELQNLFLNNGILMTSEETRKFFE